MNDCVWFMFAVCDCDNYKCDKYLDLNSDEGQKISEQYKEDINEAFEIVKEKYINLYAIK